MNLLNKFKMKIILGSRIHTLYEFGCVRLVIEWLTMKDSGEYMCVATNKYGTDMTKAYLTVHGK